MAVIAMNESRNGAVTGAEDADPPSQLEEVSLETEFLIVGAGPAGAALACFLASYGLKGVMISAAPGTSHTPRAHITNMAAMECLRDVGLDREMERMSSKGDCMIHTRWCHSMAGEEYGRIHSWGNAPDRKGDYESASPCSPCDLPQTLLEPLLVRHAVHHGFKVRFDTTFQSFEDNGVGTIKATLFDQVSNTQYKVRTKYLFGADGARSQVVKQLGLPLTARPGGGLAINVLVKTDLSHLVKHRQGNLHWIMQPEKEHPAFGWMCVVRMVKPWNEWMFILFPDSDYDPQIQPSKEEYQARVEELIGDGTPAEILDVSKWNVNDIVAEKYSAGNVFCLGDAVHRHPPFNGLGSNTCIQDAFNLAWKVAYVHRGSAHPSLLDSYNTERQPVGDGIVTRANQSFRAHRKIWEALGTLPKDVAERKQILENLRAATPQGAKQRQALRDGIASTSHELHALGIEMGQVYNGSAVYGAGEAQPYQRSGRAAENDVLYYGPSTYPGCRLPHVWLNRSIPTAYTSTVDIAGHGAFTLFTGIGGEAWKQAAESVSSSLNITVRAYSIGFRQEWEDVYSDWDRVRRVGESGAVLVRPDRFVAWRAQEALEADACHSKLLEVMRSVLGYKRS